MSALSNSYHPACFICVACMAPINESTFNSTADFTDDGTRLPVHSTCYKELYIPRCVVCQDTVTQDPATGGYTFQKHPYFQDWKYCSVHNNRLRCTGCSRVEPLEGFADINDAGRCLYESCCRTAILESGELKDLWGDVLEFMEALGRHLPIRTSLSKTLLELLIRTTTSSNRTRTATPIGTLKAAEHRLTDVLPSGKETMTRKEFFCQTVSPQFIQLPFFKAM